jgi:hypothetical protein
VTQAAIRNKLNKDEADELAKGMDIMLHADVSPCVLITTGLDLEDLQYVESLLMCRTVLTMILFQVTPAIGYD